MNPSPVREKGFCFVVSILDLNRKGGHEDVSMISIEVQVQDKTI